MELEQTNVAILKCRLYHKLLREWTKCSQDNKWANNTSRKFDFSVWPFDIMINVSGLSASLGVPVYQVQSK